MDTVTDNLRSMAEEIRSLLEELLIKYSSIKKWNYPGSNFISLSGDYGWNPLEASGLRIQSKALEEYRRFSAIAHSLFREQPKNALHTLDEADKTLTRVIEQHEVTWIGDTQEAFLKSSQALDSIIALLGNLYDTSDGTVIYVPDTNALLHNTQIEKWHFPSVRRFTIALTPAVLSELDQLKINHRVEDVRKKSEEFIRRIKEYGRRGRLSEGVTIVRDVIDLFAVAVEPDVGKTLPWLDRENTDDRILAATIEIMRMRPRSAVILVTKDINLQNKAQFARMPFEEPPDP